MINEIKYKNNVELKESVMKNWIIHNSKEASEKAKNESVTINFRPPVADREDKIKQYEFVIDVAARDNYDGYEFDISQLNKRYAKPGEVDMHYEKIYVA